MSRDDSKNITKIFIDYKAAVNTAVQYDNEMNYSEAMNYYQKALDISNQIANLPQNSYAVAIKQKNYGVQQRLCELRSQQQLQNPTENVQYPAKPISNPQNNQKQNKIPPKSEYPKVELLSQNQNQYENPPKTQVPNACQQNDLYNQNQPKLYENPPKTQYPNQYQQINVYNQQKYDITNQNKQKQYENPPKTQYPMQYQQNNLYNPPKYEMNNQNQPKQYVNPPKTQYPNQYQQNNLYNPSIYTPPNQPPKYENPPKTQYPNQYQQNNIYNPSVYAPPNPQKKDENRQEIQKPNLIQQNFYYNPQKQPENPNSNLQKQSKKSPNEIPQKFQKQSRARSPPDLIRNPHQQKNSKQIANPENKELDFHPSKSKVMSIIKSTESSDDDSIQKANKRTKKPSKTSSDPKTNNSDFFTFELDNNDESPSKSSPKQNRPKRSKSTKAMRSSKSPNHSLPPLLSNIVVQYDMFTIERKIGSGSYGVVYLVKENSTNKEYALKEIESPIISRLSEQQLLREIELMNLARHPLVCHLRGFSFFSQSTIGHHPFIVTDYYPNGSLEHVVSGKRKFNATQKLIVLYGIANAMAYLHNIGIVHRDLKPDNVLLDQNDYPIVCDFGLSKLMEMPSLRQTTAAGSPVYMAPELMKREIYTNSIDVYAFAYICFELLTETLAFDEVKDIATLVNLVCNDKRRPNLNGFDEAVLPKVFKKLISRCWSDNYEDRPSFKNIVGYFHKGILRIQGVDEKKFKDFISSVPKL